jgi:hypothetical protein
MHANMAEACSGPTSGSLQQLLEPQLPCSRLPHTERQLLNACGVHVLAESSLAL